MSRDDIRDVIKLLNDTEATYWLVGGAAIELLVGQPTRSHTDIDVFVEHTQLQQCMDRFIEAGFAMVAGTYGEEGVFLHQADLLVDFTKVHVDADGSLGTFGMYAAIPWPCDLLGLHQIDVDGVPCRTLMAANHLRMKHVVAKWFADGQMRAKDVEDVHWLEAML